MISHKRSRAYSSYSKHRVQLNWWKRHFWVNNNLRLNSCSLQSHGSCSYCYFFHTVFFNWTEWPTDILFCTVSKFHHNSVSISFGEQVKVVLRVNPSLSESQGQPPVLRIDPSKKRVTIVEPVTKSQQRGTMTLGRDGKSHLKTFTFDSAYPQESSQVWLCWKAFKYDFSCFYGDQVGRQWVDCVALRVYSAYFLLLYPTLLVPSLCLMTCKLIGPG